MSYAEVSSGGDNRNNSCMVLAAVLIRHAENREPHRLEINIGETNEEKDKIEFVKELLIKISYELVRMNINAEGNCCMSVSELTNLTFSSTVTNENCMFIEFFLTGNIKRVFQLVDRNTHDSSYFLFCKCRQTVCKNTCNLSDNLENDGNGLLLS